MDNYTGLFVIFGLILWITLREKTLKPKTLWIMPVLWAYMILPSIRWQTVDLITIVLSGLCLILGLALGIVRGKLEKMRVRRDGSISIQGSLLSVLILIGVLALRLAANHWGETHTLANLANALLFIPLGSICARRYTIYKRSQGMLSRNRI